jgi:hypothetical protein
MVRAMVRPPAPRLVRAALLVAGSLLSGCATSAVRVDSITVVYASAPAPHPIDAHLYLHVDPTRIADQLVTDDPNTMAIEVHSLRTFVRRDVRRVLADHFTDIEVVDQAPVAATPHYVAEVTVVRLGTSDAVAGGVSMQGQWGGQSLAGNRAVVALDWTLVIRDGLSDQVVYSFADQATGTFASRDVEQTPRLVASALEAALRNLARDLRTEQIGAVISARPRSVAAGAPSPAAGSTAAARTADKDDDASDDDWAPRPGYAPPP